MFQQVDVSNLDLSDDEELRDQMDMHTIIISCVNEEPLFTAEQVRLHAQKLNIHTNLIRFRTKLHLVSLTALWSRTCTRLFYNVCVDQVIEEIEEIMQQSPDGEEHENPSQFDLSAMPRDLHKLTHSTSSSSCEERKSSMCFLLTIAFPMLCPFLCLFFVSLYLFQFKSLYWHWH